MYVSCIFCSRLMLALYALGAEWTHTRPNSTKKQGRRMEKPLNKLSYSVLVYLHTLHKRAEQKKGKRKRKKKIKPPRTFFKTSWVVSPDQNNQTAGDLPVHIKHQTANYGQAHTRSTARQDTQPKVEGTEAFLILHKSYDVCFGQLFIPG